MRNVVFKSAQKSLVVTWLSLLVACVRRRHRQTNVKCTLQIFPLLYKTVFWGGEKLGGVARPFTLSWNPFTLYHLTNCSMSLCRSGSKISEQNIASRRNNNNSKLKIKQKKITETQRHHLQGTKIKQRHNIWVTTSASKASIYCSQTKTLLNKAPRY